MRPTLKEKEWWDTIRQTVTRSNVRTEYNFGGAFVWSHLHETAYLGYTLCVRWLIVTRGADVNHKCTVTHRSPLHIAAFEGHTKTIETLLDYKADIEAIDFNGATPLFLAKERSQVNVVNTLLRRGAQ